MSSEVAASLLRQPSLADGPCRAARKSIDRKEFLEVISPGGGNWQSEGSPAALLQAALEEGEGEDKGGILALSEIPRIDNIVKIWRRPERDGTQYLTEELKQEEEVRSPIGGVLYAVRGTRLRRLAMAAVCVAIANTRSRQHQLGAVRLRARRRIRGMLSNVSGVGAQTASTR